MSSRNKARRIEDFDPNQSDPNDSDFEDAPASSSRPRSRKSQKKKSLSGPRSQTKRRRARHSGDSDIVDDDEEFSEEEFSESSAEEESVVINPKTGRPSRGVVVKQTVNYEESDAEEEPNFIEDTGDDEVEADEPVNSPKLTRVTPTQPTKPLRIVILPFSNWEALGISPSTRTKPAVPQSRARSTRSRTASKPPIAMVGTRRSSRLSREPEPMVALSSSGRHAIPATPTDNSEDDDDDNTETRTRAGKSLTEAPGKKSAGKQPARKMPSIVMEASHEGTQDEAEEEIAEEIPHEVVDSVEFAHKVAEADVSEDEEQGKAPSVEGAVEPTQDNSDESEGPIKPRWRNLRSAVKVSQPSPAKRKRAQDESSEFSPEDAAAAEEENMSDEDDGRASKRLRRSSSSRTGGGGRRTRHSQRSRRVSDDEEDDDEPDPDEVMMEAEDLERPRRQMRLRKPIETGIVFEARSTRRAAAKVDYRIAPMAEVLDADNEAALAADTEPVTKRRRRDGDRRLFNIAGPFGGFNLPPALLPGPHGHGDEIPLGGGDPDSSDDEMPQQLKTPAPHDAAGGPANFGKLNKEKRGLADSDPLGVDENVKFDAVGGLDGHIDSLKEMVLHPLMYPEVIQKFGVQPPRGVLFHGPPGTGKTLLARALSNSIESGGKKVTFFMRKGADALSKWVGEAERQLRLLFEEAQKCQPSIIFFDEIDGLAPVRSSKTEQIHASIVATLLALMDGMDNRGQVVVIGATNRPDNVDPALRRPGRFDREFYFPLPDKLARRSIIDINTKGWEPSLPPAFKDQLADLTVGYGGADLRALCTEAALNAIQGTYPQIYKSNKKLAIDASKIKVLAKDFMISINKIVPSSARSNNSQVEPLAKSVEPLLRKPLANIGKMLDEILPRRKKLTALQEAEFDDRDDVAGFEKEALQRDIDRARVFRPRLLVRGLRGMGQQEIGAALLHKLEGLFVQSFDMATLLEDSSRSAEAAVVQLFKEVRRQKPSVIFIPDVDIWYDAVGHNVVKIFMQQLRSIPANDPVLLLGMMATDMPDDKPDPAMLRDLFGFSKKSDFVLERPAHDARHEYFETLIGLIQKRPTEFPDPENRKKRKLEELEEVPELPAIVQANEKAQRKKQHKDDRHALNMLKIAVQPVLDQIKKKYKRFFQSQIPDRLFEYLYHDHDTNTLTSDLTEEQRQVREHRPFIIATDEHGTGGLKEVATGKFFYNLELSTIEERLAHGYYSRYKDFLRELKTLLHDAEMAGDQAKILAAQEMVNNVEVDMYNFEKTNPQLDQYLATMYARERRRKKEAEEAQARATENRNGEGPSNGAILLGDPPVPGLARPLFPPPVTPIRKAGQLSNGESSHAETNGTANTNGDVEMADEPKAHEQEASKAMPAPRHIHSQQSALEKMAAGSQVDDYHNSGSTTTSGQNNSNRTSGATAPSNHTPAGYPAGHSHAATTVAASVAAGSTSAPAAGGVPASGVAPAGGPNTQGSSSNGTDSRYYPNFDSAAILEGGSQIPDTQPNSDGQNSHPHTNSGGSTQATHPGNIHALLNKGKEGDVPLEPKGKEREVASEVVERNVLGLEAVKGLHDLLVERTSGMSVEQLEQVMSELTNEVVKLRAEWDKHVVVERLETMFEMVRKDIEELQVKMDASWE